MESQPNTNSESEKKVPSFIFGQKIAKAMNKVDMKTQLEASMLSIIFTMLGLIVFAGYFVYTSQWPWWMRGITLVEFLAGAVMMFSYLLTTYQIYKTYMDARIANEAIQKIMEEEKSNLISEKEVKHEKSEN